MKYSFAYFFLIAVKDLARDMMGTLLLQVPLKCLVEGIMTLLVWLLEVCICSIFVPKLFFGIARMLVDAYAP